MDKNTRNIILIGITGSGKSALANTLIGKDYFLEGDLSVSTTKEPKDQLFKWNKQYYKIVDTVGINDTEFNKKDVLIKLAEIIHFIPEGISHILFVYDGKFTKEELKMFESIKGTILESEASKFTTIIRTNFEDFRNYEKCLKDKFLMIEQNEKIKDLIESCNGILHVDNPTIKEEDGSERIFIKNKYAKEDREQSKEIIMKHLENNFKGYYKLKIDCWDVLLLKINEYFDEKEKNKAKAKTVGDLEERIKKLEDKEFVRGIEEHFEETSWWNKMRSCNIL